MAAYPKEFFEQARIEVEAGLCFVVMPFVQAFDRVWATIRATAESDTYSLRCVRADDISRPGYIMEDVLEHIARADIILADLTDRNPNVFYELGIAHTVKSSSRVFLLSQRIEDIPFDLRHLRFLIYDPDLSDLQQRLSSALSQGLTRRQYRVVLHEQERKKFPARLSGKDHCLYEVELEGDYVGTDGVKFMIRINRFVAGQAPAQAYEGGCYLGNERTTLELPQLGWNLRFEGADGREAKIILQRSAEVENSPRTLRW